MSLRPWGVLDPNSAHQLWSRWKFRVRGRHVPIEEVRLNAARWLKKGFGSVGQARVQERIEGNVPTYLIEAEVEGVPAHDPEYVSAVRREFLRFASLGWGPTAAASVEVEILAGDLQDGRPRQQLVVMGQVHNMPGHEGV